VLARAHQDTVWRRCAEANRLRNLLREYFPAALVAFPDLTTWTALLLLTAAPTPTEAARLTHADLMELLRRAGRGTLPKQAARLREVFTAEQLRQPAAVEAAMGTAAAALVLGLEAANAAVSSVEGALTGHSRGTMMRRSLAASQGWESS
jgi:hypothetical protein